MSISPAILMMPVSNAVIALAQQNTGSFPMVVGNYWIYKGHVVIPALSLSDGRLVPPESKELTWRSEIIKVVHRDNGRQENRISSPVVTAAVFNNFPLGLTAWSPGFERIGGLLIKVNSNRFYEIKYNKAGMGQVGWQNMPAEIAELLRRIHDPNDKLADLLEDTEILDLPLAPKKHWGKPFMTWEVILSEKNPMIGVRGAPTIPGDHGFVLETADNTGTVRFTFVPGIGITHIFGESLFPRGNSNHRELDARLVEVHLNETKALVDR